MNNKPIFIVRRTDQSDDELYHWKYIDKIKLPDGTFKYIYEQAKNAVGNAIGINRRNAMNTAQTNLAVTRTAATNANNSRIATINKSERAKVDAGAKLQNELANPSLFGHNKKVRTLNETRMNGNKADVEKANQRAMDAGNAYRKANKDYAEKKAAYDKSLLGRLDKAGDAIKKTASDAGNTLEKWGDKAEKAAKKGIDDVKDKLGFDERDAYRESERKYESAKNTADWTRRNVKTRQVQKDVAGSELKNTTDNAVLFRNRQINNATKKYEDSKTHLANAKRLNASAYAKEIAAQTDRDKKQSDYYKTPMGKIDKTGKKIKKGINKVDKALKKWRRG